MGFSRLALPFDKLMRKVRSLFDTTEREKSFESLSSVFSIPHLILSPPVSVDFRLIVMLQSKGMVVYSCSMGKSACPMHHGKLKPYESQVHFHSARIKYETETLVRVTKGLWHQIQFIWGESKCLVAEALKLGKSGMIAGIKIEEEIIRDLERLDIELCVHGTEGFLNLDKQTEFHVDSDGILWQGTKLCVPEDPALREVLPRTSIGSTRQLSGFWSVVDRLTKPAHFLPIPSLSDRDPVSTFVSGKVKERIGNQAHVQFGFSSRDRYGQSERTIRHWRTCLDHDRLSGVLEGPEMIEVTDEKVYEEQDLFPFVKILWEESFLSVKPLGKRGEDLYGLPILIFFHDLVTRGSWHERLCLGRDL
ncbi:hypothetical protein Tco_0320433 [Tanacetum coccineum]